MDPNAGRPTVMETPIHEPKPVVLSTPIADPRPVLPGYEADQNAERGVSEGFDAYDGPQINVFDAEISESGRMFGTHKELTKAKAQDSHHIIQHAAVKDIPGYDFLDAPTVQLEGPSQVIGTEHQLATKVQRSAGGGNYAAERRIGYKALRKAGVPENEARDFINNADQYFQKLGVKPDTKTAIPGNRKGPK